MLLDPEENIPFGSNYSQNNSQSISRQHNDLWQQIAYDAAAAGTETALDEISTPPTRKDMLWRAKKQAAAYLNKLGHQPAAKGNAEYIQLFDIYMQHYLAAYRKAVGIEEKDEEAYFPSPLLYTARQQAREDWEFGVLKGKMPDDQVIVAMSRALDEILSTGNLDEKVRNDIREYIVAYLKTYRDLDKQAKSSRTGQMPAVTPHPMDPFRP
jgi:hypothetical protein